MLSPQPEISQALRDDLSEAVRRLGQDGFVAYPTETVWGLGACADRPRAIERLMAWKGRAGDAPLAVLVPCSDPIEAAGDLGCELTTPVRRLIEAFWPGPLMLVVPCRAELAPGVARADGALGLRCSPHPVASALAEALSGAGLGPLTSTSLNRSGEAPAETSAEAASLVGEPSVPPSSTPLDRPLLVSVRDCDAGGELPSTVVDCAGAQPRVLRVGAIDRESIDRCWNA